MKLTVYTCAYNKERNAHEIAQKRVMDVLYDITKDIKVIRVYTAKNKIFKFIKITRDIFCLINPFVKHRVFFYPTVPVFPISKSKWKLTKPVYNLMNRIDKVFKIKRTVFLMDMPVEQGNDLKISFHNDEKSKIVKSFEKMLTENADYIVDPGNYSALCPENNAKIIKTRFSPCKIECNCKKKKADEKIHIFYAGDMRREYEENIICDLIEKTDFGKYDAHMHICGYCNPKLAELIKNKENMKYYGYVSNDECNEIARQCDFAVMIYPNLGYYNYVSTTKFVTYIGCELPILSVNAQMIKENIEYFGVGEAVSKEEFQENIEKWLSEKRYSCYVENVTKLRQSIADGSVFSCLKEITEE